jgi:hypothetical protein
MYLIRLRLIFGLPAPERLVWNLRLGAKPLGTTVPRVMSIKNEPRKTVTVRGPASGMTHQGAGVAQTESQHLLAQPAAGLFRCGCRGIPGATRAGELYGPHEVCQLRFALIHLSAVDRSSCAALSQWTFKNYSLVESELMHQFMQGDHSKLVISAIFN